MKLTSLSNVRALLEQWGIRPQKSLGQNFLIDANILDILRQAADLQPDDQVLEIGTGLGILTEVLTPSAQRVVSVEKDRRLWDYLRERFRDTRNLELICGDMLELDSDALFASGINKVVANLPYSVGSAILVNFFKAVHPPQKIVVTLQQEVADRLVAGPNQHAFGLLSLWGQLTYEVSIRKIISPTCFFPSPNVKSAIIEMERRNSASPDDRVKTFFFELTKFAFTRRRKQLQTVFREPPPDWKVSAVHITTAMTTLGLDPHARPEALSVPQWLSLASQLVERVGSNH